MMNRSPHPSALSQLPSAIASAVLLLMTVSLLLPIIAHHRELARQNTCASRLQTLARGLHNYHSAYKRLPMGSGGTDGNGQSELGNGGRLSGFVGLLPFIEQMALWEKISNPYRVGDRTFPPMGPSPAYDPAIYPFWGYQVEMFLCPSEPVTPSDFGLRSFVMCYGDGIENIEAAGPREARAVCRGMFGAGHPFRLRDCLDGLSNTILLSETAIGTGDPLVIGGVAKNIEGIAKTPIVATRLRSQENREDYDRDVDIWPEGKGSRWADGSFRITGFNTVLPPNSPSCTSVNNPSGGIMSATSHHPGGVHVVMCDGVVRMVSNSIDTGDLNATSVAQAFGNAGRESPYGVWGALGTRASKELIPSQAEAAFTNVNPSAENTKKETSGDFEERLEALESKMDRIIKLLERR